VTARGRVIKSQINGGGAPRQHKGESSLKRCSRILIGAGCLLLLIVSWAIAVNSKSAAEKQLELMHQAAVLVMDGIYIHAVPLLEEAAGYNAAHTLAAEEELKKVYLALIESGGFRRKYISLLEKQMNRAGADPGAYEEAANYYLGISRIQYALAVLKEGIEKTGSDQLIAIYETNRYAYETNRMSYESVTVAHGSAIQVQIEGRWGLASADGVLFIPCEYEKISTFSANRAIVKKEGRIYAVDENNNRVAILHGSGSDFGNFANNRIAIFVDGGWRRATGDFSLGTAVFEEFGMYSGGYAAAKTGGKWGVIDLESNWLIPAEYDEIIKDELGRSFAQGGVFARRGDAVYLLVGNRQIGEPYEDARPFSNTGFAAVKRNGKWGFIDVSGKEMIGFMFDDALSFGQHLAAIKQGELWGYINMSGNVVIEPAFLMAKSFAQGSAPVLTQRGWQFITLLEYRGQGLSLLQ